MAHRQAQQASNPGQLRLVALGHGLGAGGLEKRLNGESILETRIWTQRASLALPRAAG